MTTDSHRYSAAHEAWVSGSRTCEDCQHRCAHRIVTVPDMHGRMVTRAVPGCDVLHTHRQPVTACPVVQSREVRA